MDGVSGTALWMAAARARESARPDRLFDDPLAEPLAGREGFDLMARMEAGLGENPTLVIRHRFFDDAVVAAVKDRRVTQVVLLAAGMDSRAFRLDLPYVFEIDRRVVIDLKESRLAAASACPRGKRVSVGVDLTEDWPPELMAAGFHADLPSVFLAEGLLGYLDEPDVHGLLDRIDQLAAPGSVLLADVGGRSALESAGLAFWYQRCAENGIANARFGTDDPEGLLAAHGWRARVHQYGDERATFGRWPLPPMARDDLSLPHSYLMIGQR